jgi:ABC-type xylose transport system permease subunit
MSHSDPVQRLLREEPDLEIHFEQQRERIVRAIRRHQFRHKWIVRTFTTFFWTTAAGAFLMAALLHNLWLMASGTVWLLLGAVVLLQSRLRHLELKIDGVLALLGTRDKAAPVEQPRHGG